MFNFVLAMCTILDKFCNECDPDEPVRCIDCDEGMFPANHDGECHRKCKDFSKLMIPDLKSFCCLIIGFIFAIFRQKL